MTRSENKMKRWFSIGIWLVIAAGLVTTFAGAFQSMWFYHWFPAWRTPGLGLYKRLVEGDSYYTHAPLIALVSIIMGWLLCRHTRIPVRPRPIIGTAVLVMSLLLQWISCVGDVDFTKGFAFIGVLMGLVLMLWGGAALRRLWFPLALLLFMMPVPPMVIAQSNFRLKILAADWGVGLANLIGFPAERSGARLLLEGGKEMLVGNACSGLRTLISLFAFGAIYAVVCRLRGWWRLGLFAMTLPIALVSNCLRITGLIIVAHFTDVATATGTYHDISGVLVFVCAFLMMFGLEKSVLWIRAKMGTPTVVAGLYADVRLPQADRSQAAALVGAPGTWRGALAAILVLACTAGVWATAAESQTTEALASLREAVPAQLQVGSDLATGRDCQMDEGTLRILQTDNYVSRVYRASDGASVDVCIIASKGNRRGSHPPDFCLEGGGGSIIVKNPLCLADVPELGELSCRELVLQRGGQYEYYLYVYRCGNSYTSSWYWQQVVVLGNRLVGNKIGGALVRLSTSARGVGDGEARQRLMNYMRAVIPHVSRAVQ